jgi:hypothetical protein
LVNASIREPPALTGCRLVSGRCKFILFIFVQVVYWSNIYRFSVILFVTIKKFVKYIFVIYAN